MIEPAALAAIALSSLLGSLHCAGMCGPLVAAACGPAGSPRVRVSVNGREVTRPTLVLNLFTYHAGRLVGYVALGALAGVVGGAVNLAGRLAGAQHVALNAAAGVVILLGLGMVLASMGWAPRLPFKLAWSPAGWIGARVNRWSPVARAGSIGLLSGMLPCGWLWVFVVAASGTGSLAGGMLTMLAFWLGTVPMLTVLGLGLARLLAPLRERIPFITGVAIVALGGIMLSSNAIAHASPTPLPSCCNAP